MNAELDAWRRAGQTLHLAGRQVFFRVDGPADAPVLLLIHGFPTASWDWHLLWPELVRHYRLISVDMLGFGFSDKPTPHAYSIFEQADIQEAVLRHCAVANYDVLAHDYGDTVAQELLARQDSAEQRPRLCSVCFLNGGLFAESHRPLLIQKLLLSVAGPLLACAMRKGSLARSMRRIFGPYSQPSHRVIDAFWALISEQRGTRVIPALLRYIPERISHRARWVGATQSSKVPISLINGAHDPISGAHMQQRFRELIPSARITDLPGIGHYPQLEAPDAVLYGYLRFRGKLQA